MPDPLEQVLRLVADGRLTAAEAAPILDALAEGNTVPEQAAPRPTGPESAESSQGARSIRIEVKEGGRQVVNLRIPVSLGRFALDRIPGLSETSADLVRRAMADGRIGNLLVVDDDDGEGGVRIALE